MSDLMFFLGSFAVSVQAPWPADSAELFPIRQAVTEGLDVAAQEFVNTRVLETRIVPRATVTAMQPGSVELLVLVHGLLQLPDLINGLMSEPAVHQTLEILKGLGTAVGTTKSLVDGGRWISGRLHQKHQAIAADPSIAQISFLDVQPVNEETAGEPPRPLAAKEVSARDADAWVDDPIPRAVAVAVDPQTTRTIQLILRVPDNNNTHLGGPTIIRDGNLYRNGLQSLDDLREGGVFVLHNAAALGLQPVPGDSLYAACADPNSGIRLVDVRLDTIEVPDEEPRRLTAETLNIDDPRMH